MPALQRTATTILSNSTDWLMTTEAFNDTDYDDDNSTAPTWPDSCPNDDAVDSQCHDAWPLWVEIGVPIFCIGAFIAALLVIYLKPSKSAPPKRRTASEAASEVELQGLRSVNMLGRGYVSRRSDASSIDTESERSRSPLEDSSRACQKKNCPSKSNGNTCPPAPRQLLENIPEHAATGINSTRI